MDSKKAREIIESGRRKVDAVVTDSDKAHMCLDIVQVETDFYTQLAMLLRWERTFGG
jgi:hypothetical protein